MEHRRRVHAGVGRRGVGGTGSMATRDSRDTDRGGHGRALSYAGFEPGVLVATRPG